LAISAPLEIKILESEIDSELSAYQKEYAEKLNQQTDILFKQKVAKLEKDKAEYTKTITESNVADYHFEDTVLYVSFLDGNKYEYFGVPRSVYVKMVNAESPARFARRHIFSTYTYRSAMKLVGTEE